MMMPTGMTIHLAGRKAATKWVRSHGARIPEDAGCRIHDACDQLPNGVLDLLENVKDAYTPAERLYFVMFDIGEHDRDRGEAHEFWESVCDDSNPDVDFLNGFGDEVWGIVTGASFE